MDQFTQVGFARFVFGLLAQDGRMTLRTVADDAATVMLSNGQAFTVTVTASRPKVAAPMAYTKPAVEKRGKDGKA